MLESLVAPGSSSIPEATPRKGPCKLTIAMATYDDYDGVYFTIQAIRLYHPEVLGDVQFVVVDNQPEGAAAPLLKNLDHWIDNYRYIPCGERSGTAVRDRIFAEAEGTFVLCLDCHVMLVPGALRKLVDYYDAHPGTPDLLQGPLLYDGLKTIATHWEPGWRFGSYGIWALDPRGEDADGPPFEIPSQGLGLFSCRRAAWPGFNPRFRGFGGEEGYVHEKFRRRGARTLCLPFLRWIHRFGRPHGTSYPNTWEDRVANYLIGHQELGMPIDDIIEHFSTYLGPKTWASIQSKLAPEFGILAQAGEPDAAA